jgi:hypothetical protein
MKIDIFYEMGRKTEYVVAFGPETLILQFIQDPGCVVDHMATGGNTPLLSTTIGLPVEDASPNFNRLSDIAQFGNHTYLAFRHMYDLPFTGIIHPSCDDQGKITNNYYGDYLGCVVIRELFCTCVYHPNTVRSWNIWNFEFNHTIPPRMPLLNDFQTVINMGDLSCDIFNGRQASLLMRGVHPDQIDLIRVFMASQEFVCFCIKRFKSSKKASHLSVSLREPFDKMSCISELSSMCKSNSNLDLKGWVLRCSNKTGTMLSILLFVNVCILYIYILVNQLERA